MFGVYHFAWMAISILVIYFSLRHLLNVKYPLKKLIWFGFYAGILVEFIKVFSLVQMVPSADGTMFFPYIETQHVPLHLCAMQKFLMAFVLFTKNEEARDNVIAFMYPTAMVGAFIALIVPSGASIEWSMSSFLNPQAYQFFLYHSFLVILGAYIVLSGQFELKKKHFLSSLALLGGFGLVSMYLNSALATARYNADKIVSVDYTPNYLFTYKPPIKLPITEVWHWYLYVGAILILALITIAICYIPVLKRQEALQKDRTPKKKVKGSTFLKQGNMPIEY